MSDAAAEGARRDRRVPWIALLLLAVAGTLYAPLRVPGYWNRSDPLLIVPTTLSLLHDGDLALDELAAEIDPGFHGVLLVDGVPYNRYPIGTSLIVLPVVWLADRLLPPGPRSMGRAMTIAAIAGKTLAALSVALLFVLLAELATLPVASALALVFGVATLHMPTHAGALFTHNAVIPLLLAALILLARGRAAWAAAALAAAFVTRPTCAPAIVVVTAWMARHRRAVLPRYVSAGAAVGAAFTGWSLAAYGTVLPPYYTGYDDTAPYVMTPGRFLEGLAGHLVSPSRGLFVFTPILLFSLWGMARALRGTARHATVQRMIAAIVVVHWIAISVLARRWWGGWSIGPRHLAEMLPLLVVLLVPAIEAFRAAPRRVRAWLVPPAAAALAWSLFTAVHAATSTAPGAWNATPANVDLHPERLWDWRDPQILRGVGS